MNARRIIAAILALGGIALILLSNEIKRGVAQGKEQVADAQQKVDITKGLFSLSPATKGIGENIGQQAQGKIDQGILTIQQYDKYGHWSMIAGIVLVAFGLFFFLIPRKK